MLKSIRPFLQKPALYQPGTAQLWTDDHISRGMLAAHLHPATDAATRNHAFVRASAVWLATLLPPARFPRLVDLGCGPGVYAQQFCGQGYDVTGVDISARSIRHAARQAHTLHLPITYRQANYLDMTYENQFNIATLIFCDFGVLPPAHRRGLLGRVYRALCPGGRLVFDVFTPLRHAGKQDARTWRYEDSGFFKPTPHLNLETFIRYDEDNTVLTQHIIVGEGPPACYNLWEHTFTREELARDLTNAGFASVEFFDDIAGAPCTGRAETLCAVAAK